MKQCTVLNIHQPYSHFLLCEFVFEKPTLASPSTTSLLWWIWKNNIALASTLASCSARKGHMNRDDKSICYIVTWNDSASLWKLLLFLTHTYTDWQPSSYQLSSPCRFRLMHSWCQEQNNHWEESSEDIYICCIRGGCRLHITHSADSRRSPAYQRKNN